MVLQNLIYFLLVLVLLRFKNVFHIGMFETIYIYIFKKALCLLGLFQLPCQDPVGVPGKQKQGDIWGCLLESQQNLCCVRLGSSPASAFSSKTSLPQQKDLHTERAEFQLKTGLKQT